MKNKKILAILTLTITIILLAQQASSLGITPGRKTMDFEPGKSKEVPFSIINSENKKTSAVLQVTGEMNQSIVLNKRKVDISKDDDKKQLSYTVNMPQEFEEPGKHKAEIRALEIPGNAEEGKFVGATVSVATQVHVEVPYPGKYLEIKDITINTGQQKDIFYIPIENKGQANIAKAKAEIEIYNPGNELVGTIKTGEKSIDKGKRSELVKEWKNDLKPGNYRAEITVTYDGKTANKEKEFEIGENSIEIERIEVEDFELGEVAKLNSMTKNNYNKKVENAFIKMTVFDKEDKILADIKSRTYTIKPRSKKNMVAYWDTKGVEEGDYRGKVELNHSIGTFEREVTFKVSSDDIVVQGIGGEVIAEQVEEGNLKQILIIAVIALAVLNIIWFFVIRKILKKKNKSIKSIFSRNK